ncbi:MAG: hypothetical protein A3K10_11215 [Bacteroidetes bacterium RIFCSPLOWO2_12_FULL_31_6]|nr:MAG: hypothetical protein A3K10_11215 [Bacteroidetes bacterium RIFCSPLOWO2_12_FULL_31_6]
MLSGQSRELDSIQLLLNKERNDTIRMVILNDLSEILWRAGNYKDALANANNAKFLAIKVNNKYVIAGACYNKGAIYYAQANYPEAIKNYYEVLKNYEQIENNAGMANAFACIGLVNSSINNYPEALKNHLSALELYKTLGNKDGISACYNNIGMIYDIQGKNIEALNSYNDALKIALESGRKEAIASGYDNIGCIYAKQNNYIDALNYFNSGLKIREEIGNKRDIASSYNNIGKLQMEQKKYREAIKYLNQGLINSKEIGALDVLKDSEELLSELFEKTNETGEALRHYKAYIIIRDSIYNEEATKKTIQTQMNYEFGKKEAVLKVKQEKEKALAGEKNRRQQIVIWSVIGGLGLVLVFAIFVYRSLRITRKQKYLIETQKTEVEKSKLIIEEKNKDITDSITYAKRLQDAILAPLAEIKANISDYFVLYKPKDIVAGDFYWAEKIENYYFIAAADCTGHGVPGAMVSMVCSNALNRTVNEFGITETGKILDNVRDLVLDTFKKSGEEIKDGMDISLCRIDKVNNEIQWSGANNPLWYFVDNELIEIKADKQPIGKYDEPKPFTTHTLKLPTTTNLYMFTDGYADQFSSDDKKMTKKRFKDIVTSVQNKTMTEQKQIINDFFVEWKKNAEQVDDVCVIGMRI